MAGVLVLAVIATLVYASDFYEHWGYEDGHHILEIPRTWVGETVPQRAARKKRWSLLPGPAYLFEKTCYYCLNDMHSRCPGIDAMALWPDWESTSDSQTYTCTCPDASHKDKP